MTPCKQGMLSTRGRRILFVDADGATKFSDLDMLEKRLDDVEGEIARRAGGIFGIAVGSRAHMVKTDAVVKVGLVFLVHMGALDTSNAHLTP